jgi:hypothetical protein
MGAKRIGGDFDQHRSDHARLVVQGAVGPFDLGAAVADEIIRGRRRTELTHFRPARFFN